MAETFNPAPHDKHADDLHEALAADRSHHARRRARRIVSRRPIPSAPPQPTPSKADADADSPSLWDKVKAHLQLEAEGALPNSDRLANALVSDALNLASVGLRKTGDSARIPAVISGFD